MSHSFAIAERRFESNGNDPDTVTNVACNLHAKKPTNHLCTFHSLDKDFEPLIKFVNST